jgi:hypothetical protein
MRSPIARLAGIVILAAVAFGAGYIAGHRTTFAQGIQMLATETQGNLAQRLETLARIRTSDVNGAIAGLEEAVDTAALTLPQGRPWAELDPGMQFVLQIAKAYRTRYPASPVSHELNALFDPIPMPDVRYCSPAMQQLLGR